jgi:hypothetical protein
MPTTRDRILDAAMITARTSTTAKPLSTSRKTGWRAMRLGDSRKTKSGNIYIPTNKGISKSDGRSFTTLGVSATSDPTDWKLHLDDLWFGGVGKTCDFDRGR